MEAKNKMMKDTTYATSVMADTPEEMCKQINNFKDSNPQLNVYASQTHFVVTKGKEKWVSYLFYKLIE